MQKKPYVFVCSPLKGNIERNIRKAAGYARFVFTSGGIPIAPHLAFTRFLDDNIPEERAAGMEMGMQLLSDCDEVWVFGGVITGGMEAEIKAARRLGIPVKRFNNMCEPLEVEPDEHKAIGSIET